MADARKLDWKTANIRFTGFLASPVGISAAKVFEAVFGKSPETTTQSTKEIISSAITEADDVVRSIEFKVDRVDVVVGAKAGLKTITENMFPSLGDADTQFQKISDLAIATAKVVPQLDRIAIGAQCLLSSGERLQAYKHLAEILGLAYLDGETFADFQLRINHPKKIGFEGATLGINCLSSWASVAINVSTAHSGGETRGTELAHSVLADLDLNTATNVQLTRLNPPFPTDAIVRELIVAGRQTLLNGPR